MNFPKNGFEHGRERSQAVIARSLNHSSERQSRVEAEIGEALAAHRPGAAYAVLRSRDTYSILNFPQPHKIKCEI